MARRSRKRARISVEIVVALIGLGGVVTAALLSNWGAIFGRDPAPGRADEAAPTAAVAPSPAAPADLENMSDAQRRAIVESTRVLDDLADKIGAVSVENNQ